MVKRSIKKRTTFSYPYNLIAILIVGIVVGFLIGLVSTLDIYEYEPPVFAFSSGDNTTYLDIYEGERLTISFPNEDNISIGNLDDTTFFVNPEEEIASITEENIIDERIQDIAGEPTVFIILSGNNITYLELYEGKKAIVGFSSGENLTIANIDGVNYFIEYGEKGTESITEEEMDDEEIENLVGEARRRPRRRRPRPRPRCDDSGDGGKNYYEKGTTKKGTRSKTDFCINSKKLREYYCKGNRIASVRYDCSKKGMVCRKGRCVEDTITCSSCSDCTSKLDGTYRVVKLSKNINVPSGASYCVKFGANNVVFNCQGNRINGNGKKGVSGIVAENKRGIKIRNCVLSDFGDTWGYSESAIRLIRTTGSLVIGNTIRGGNDGIYLDSSPGNKIKNNIVTDSGWMGIAVLFGSNNNIIEKNDIKRARHCGITSCINVNGNILHNNSITVSEEGICLCAGSYNNILTDNYVCFNGLDIGAIGGDGYGHGNICDTTQNWRDSGYNVTNGCTHPCPR